jgi:hypothetical protein
MKNPEILLIRYSKSGAYLRLKRSITNNLKLVGQAQDLKLVIIVA